jgi:hypothetical protein
VTATNSASPAAPASASVGFDPVSEGRFGPWPCGTTTTLTATAPQGYRFDRWVSTDGLCSAGGPTCVVPITNRAYNLTVMFAPIVYQVTVNGGTPPAAGRFVGGSGNGYLSPGINCGSQPNGPIVETSSQCTSAAQAMRNDRDITQITVSRDDRGPGNQM